MAYALALRESVFAFMDDVDFYIFLSEEDDKVKKEVEALYSKTKVLTPIDFKANKEAEALKQKYAYQYTDAYRWSMKPVLMGYLLEKGYRACMYTDCDIHFYSSPDFLYKLLETHSILLSPHNRSLYGETDPQNFVKNFTEGVYNGGFVAANSNGIPALNWWLSACLYRCEKNTADGYYVDQKYLDMMASRFENVYAIKHLGCNLAEWNRTDCRRTLIKEDVLINETWPVVFIHFTSGYQMDILFGNDRLLKPHFELYAKRVKKFNPHFDLLEEAYQKQNLWLQHQESSVAEKAPPFLFSKLKALKRRLFL